MKRKSTSSGGTAKKAAADQKYDVRTGRWMVVPRTRAAATTAAAVRAAVSEKKGVDTDVSISSGSLVTTTNTNANAFVLNLVQQGTGSWNRVGRKSHLTSVRVKGILSHTATAQVTTGIMLSNFIRMVIVWDKQPSGAAIPSFDQIFGITAQDGTESCPDITCPPRYDNMDRFRVIKDKTIPMNVGVVGPTGTTLNTQHLQEVDEYVKLPSLESVYSGQSAPMTIADVSTGALYLYFRAYNNSAGASQCAVDAIARLRYTD